MNEEKTLWVQISSGRGPIECRWVCMAVASRLMAESVKLGFQCRADESDLFVRAQKTLSKDAGMNLPASVLLKFTVKFEDTEAVRRFLDSWSGSILWVGESPFRHRHKRKNWFVALEYFAEKHDMNSETQKWPAFKNEDIKIETMRAGGPGGQHVNKTESSIRVTHIPTGLSATAQENRSQSANKKAALKRLGGLLEKERLKNEESFKRKKWGQHNNLERGNPVRVFAGVNFKEVISERNGNT